MFELNVRHQALVNGWPTPSEIKDPTTLVLGSFNPYVPDGSNNVEYYYGRRSNHFWKSIERSNNLIDNYYLNNIDKKMQAMHGRFCCLDVINEISIQSSCDIVLNEYVENNIYSNYLDQKIFVSKTKFNAREIKLNRTYNNSISELLEQTSTITTVIHTMGLNRILNLLSIRPRELSARELGFGHFITNIIHLCKRRNIEFIFESHSPSGYAIRSNKTDVLKLDKWLNKHLNLSV